MYEKSKPLFHYFSDNHFIFVVIMIHSLAVHKTKSIKLYLLMKSNSPIVGIEKINDDKILLESLKTFVKRKGEKN